MLKKKQKEKPLTIYCGQNMLFQNKVRTQDTM